MPAIFLDVGHGGSDPGACANGLVEKTLNLTVATKVKELLTAKGFSVCMSREDDSDIPLDSRAAIGHEWGMEFLISIHHNAGGGTGYEIIKSLFSPYSAKMADCIANQFNAIGQTNHGLYSRRYDDDPNGSMYNTDYYAVIRESIGFDVPAIITEFAYIDSADCQKVNTTEKLYKEAEAIAKGVCDFYGVAYDTPEPTPVTNTLYRVQVGAFRNKAYADNLVKELKGKGYPAFVVEVK
jgi:N-acetylmuramoyl-L-alanine amidase